MSLQVSSLRARSEAIHLGYENKQMDWLEIREEVFDSPLSLRSGACVAKKAVRNDVMGDIYGQKAG